MKTENKILATIENIKQRTQFLNENGLLSIDIEISLNLVLEELHKCLVDWIPKTCLNCKKQISFDLVPISDHYLCEKCMEQNKK